MNRAWKKAVSPVTLLELEYSKGGEGCALVSLYLIPTTTQQKQLQIEGLCFSVSQTLRLREVK